MPTLEEVYERRLDEDKGDGGLRVRAGVALLSVGVFLMFFGGIVAFSETVAALFHATVDWERWGVGAIFAGIGLPVAFTGVFVVVPAPRRDQALGASGILVAFVGVLFFDYAYPTRWQGDPLDLTPLVFAVYALGSFLMFAALFISVLDIEISLPRTSLSFEYVDRGGGRRRDGMPEREERVPEMSNSTDGGTGGAGSAGISVETNATDAEVVRNQSDADGEDDARSHSAGFAGDRYCGNCAFYEYVQADGTNSPFCEYHERELDDLEACEQHEMRMSSGVKEAGRSRGGETESGTTATTEHRSDD